jgi:hypothetical protein
MSKNKKSGYILVYVSAIGIFCLILGSIFGIQSLLFLCSWSTTQGNCFLPIAILLFITFAVGVIFIIILKHGLKKLKSIKIYPDQDT